MKLFDLLVIFTVGIVAVDSFIRIFEFKTLRGSSGKVSRKKVSKKPQKSPRLQRLKQNSLYVPPKILKKLRGVKSTRDFLSAFGIKNEIPRPSSDGDFGLTSDPIGTSPVKMEGYDCMPRKTLVEIAMDVTAIHWPPCVFVNRCSGCCFNTHLMECQSSHVTNKSVTVYKIPYSTGIPFAEVVNVTEHASCQCQCRVKPSDCSPRQTFSANNCQCECKQDSTSCGNKKQWSQTSCQCVCSKKETCAKKFVWNSDTCSCECKRKKCRKYFKLNKTTCRCDFTGLSRSS